jgi:hypothetical protein
VKKRKNSVIGLIEYIRLIEEERGQDSFANPLRKLCASLRLKKRRIKRKGRKE